MIEKENGEVVSNGTLDSSTNGASSTTKEEKDSSTETENGEVVPNGSEISVDVILNNVVCNFSVRCHLNLKQIALTACNVEYHKAMAMLIMKFRRPPCTASIWSSGKVTMTGSTTEADAKVGARRCARVLQKLGYNVKFTNYRIVNVLATCTMPFAIKDNDRIENHKSREKAVICGERSVADFASAHPRIASYEPELHPGVTYKMKDIKATLKIFSTGSITITAPKVETVQAAVEEAYRLVYDYRKERRPDDPNLRRSAAQKRLRSGSEEEPLSVRKKHRNE